MLWSPLKHGSLSLSQLTKAQLHPGGSIELNAGRMVQLKGLKPCLLQRDLNSQRELITQIAFLRQQNQLLSDFSWLLQLSNLSQYTNLILTMLTFMAILMKSSTCCLHQDTLKHSHDRFCRLKYFIYRLKQGGNGIKNLQPSSSSLDLSSLHMTIACF